MKSSTIPELIIKQQSFRTFFSHRYLPKWVPIHINPMSRGPPWPPDILTTVITGGVRSSKNGHQGARDFTSYFMRGFTMGKPWDNHGKMEISPARAEVSSRKLEIEPFEPTMI